MSKNKNTNEKKEVDKKPASVSNSDMIPGGERLTCIGIRLQLYNNYPQEAPDFNLHVIGNDKKDYVLNGATINEAAPLKKKVLERIASKAEADPAFLGWEFFGKAGLVVGVPD